MNIQGLVISFIFILFVFGSNSFAASKGKAHERGLVNEDVRQQRRPQSRHKPLPHSYDNRVITYFGGTPIVTSPYLGRRSEFDGSDLIVNVSSINEDLRLLKHRYILDNELYKRYHKIPENPLIEISGQLGAERSYTDPYRGNGQGDLDLTDAQLDILVHAHEWVTGFIAFAFDDGFNPALVNHRLSNSRVVLDKGFITVGNLRNSPFYFTVGQTVVPFGRYSSHMIVSPLTQVLGGTKQRASIIGFKQPGSTGFFANVFYFKGSVINRGQNNGGAHLGYEFSHDGYQGEVGVSYLSNLGDADHLQITGKPGFMGFAFMPPAKPQQLHHPVSALHAYMNFSYEDLDFLAEAVSALRDFSAMDLSYNTYGARPWAVNVEGTIHFSMDGKPSSLSMGYGHSEQALAIQIPNHRIVGAFNTSWWRDTIQTFEVRHEINYNTGATASGRGNAVPTANNGQTQTSFTGNFKLYF